MVPKWQSRGALVSSLLLSSCVYEESLNVRKLMLQALTPDSTYVTRVVRSLGVLVEDSSGDPTPVFCLLNVQNFQTACVTNRTIERGRS